jgi:hypothetical protein
MLSADDIRCAFDELSAELAGEAEPAELVVVGGAALVMLFGARPATKDVDVLFLRPSAAVFRAAAALVAGRRGLPEDWLNDAAKGFLVNLELGDAVYESPALKVFAASTHQLLAMKLMAWRDAVDRADARLLLMASGGDARAIWDSVARFVPAAWVDKAWYAFQDLWEATHGPE